MLPLEQCTGCMACMSVCPIKCIQIGTNSNGFYIPIIDNKQCIHCQSCIKSCPVLNTHASKKNGRKNIFAAINTNDSIRENSSSGGIFSVLATETLKQNGVVYGAVFDSSFTVRHVSIDDINDLWKLQGSKYVQSYIGNIYMDVKQNLLSRKKVLFSGTPCQISGLRSFLEKEYDNLILVDIICHGTPSPKVWKQYLKEKTMYYKSEPIKINFRNKISGWEHFSLTIDFENGYKHIGSLDEDEYMRAFLQNYSLKESCYDCHFKGFVSGSDITLGDFWGVNQIDSSINDNKGLSLIVVNTEKGEKYLEQLHFNKYIIDGNQAILKNGAAIHSVYKPPFHKYFFYLLEKKSVEYSINKCINPSFMDRIFRKLKKL